MNAEERQALREKHRICVEKEWHCDVIKLLNAWQGQTEQLLAIIHHDTTATTHAESVELMRRILTGTATEPVGETSAEVLSTDFATMVEEGKKLAAIHPNIVVKVPMIKDGIKAIKWFTDNGIRTNCTLVFSAGQAILAAKAGATYVSPFIGRIDDSSWDGMELISQIRHIYDVQGFQTQILAASIRNALHIVKAAEAGADVCTCPLDSILGLLKHPLTDIGLAKFLEDAKKM